MNDGETPCEIYNGGAGSPVDSLYGKRYGGGYIFQFDTITCTGLIVVHPFWMSPTYQTNQPWGCSGTEIAGADGDGIYDGYQNSVDCSNDCPDFYTAPNRALGMSTAFQSDWYLPSIGELEEIYEKIYLNGNIALLDAASYWSSTEHTSTAAWSFNFALGIPISTSKGSVGKWHSIRTFFP